jgi:hypothetical protein
MSTTHDQKISLVALLFLNISLIAGFTLTPIASFASTENNDTSLTSEGAQAWRPQQMPPPPQTSPISF